MADPYTTPIPGATGYESATLAAKTAYQNALTRLNQQRGDTLRQYGYAGDIDPNTGTVGNIRVDANLPYGEFQQERQTHADQYQQARESAGERGIGHGGLAEHGVTRLRNQFGADDATLGQGLSGAISGFQDQQNQAAYERDSALSDAQLQATRDAISQQMFNPANLDGLDVPEGPDWGSIMQQLLGGDTTGNDDNSDTTVKPPVKNTPTPRTSPAATYTKAAAKAVATAKAKKEPIPYVHSPGLNTATPAAPKAPPVKKKTTTKAKAQ